MSFETFFITSNLGAISVLRLCTISKEVICSLGGKGF